MNIFIITRDIGKPFFDEFFQDRIRISQEYDDAVNFLNKSGFRVNNQIFSSQCMLDNYPHGAIVPADGLVLWS